MVRGLDRMGQGEEERVETLKLGFVVGDFFLSQADEGEMHHVCRRPATPGTISSPSFSPETATFLTSKPRWPK
jgi:hypothetical protein